MLYWLWYTAPSFVSTSIKKFVSEVFISVTIMPVLSDESCVTECWMAWLLSLSLLMKNAFLSMSLLTGLFDWMGLLPFCCGSVWLGSWSVGIFLINMSSEFAFWLQVKSVFVKWTVWVESIWYSMLSKFRCRIGLLNLNVASRWFFSALKNDVFTAVINFSGVDLLAADLA